MSGNGSYPNLAAVAESATLGMTARAAVLHTAERPVLSLSAGEPDFDTPAYIAEAGIRAIREGRTRYPPAAGITPLREAVAEYLAESCGGSYRPEEVLVSVGAKGALFDAVFTLFGPGDRVVVPAPYWVSYPAMVRLARAEPMIVETSAASGFRLEPEALDEALAAGARGVILNSPSNPTGTVLGASDLDALVSVAARHGAWIIADEIYMAIRYGGPFASVAALARDYERIVLVNGFSKAFAMTGWRVGYAAAPAELVRAMARLQGHIHTNTAAFCQHAAVAALRETVSRDAAIGEMVAAFARRRAFLLESLSAVPGFSAFPPDGAFYLWLDVRDGCAAIGGGSEELCLDLLENERLALVPGSAFGAEGYVRLSFAAAEPVLEAAAARLADAARRLGLA